MQAINNSAVLNYITPPNILNASVAFLYTPGSTPTILVTDNTTYASGDSRATVLITVADDFGVKKEYNIGASPNTLTINLLTDGFNPVNGIDMLVTVVSALVKIKDGSVMGVGEAKTAGNFIMEL